MLGRPLPPLLSCLAVELFKLTGIPAEFQRIKVVGNQESSCFASTDC